MQRIQELVDEVRARYPNDDFFSNFEQSCHENKLKREFYLTYESTLVDLDDEAWIALKEKCIRHFKNHREGQLKTGFFAQLNEAFAYKYLVSHGYSNVVFLHEGITKQPDLRFESQTVVGFCEVKSIGISDEEISRRASRECFDGSSYARLSHEFIKKLQDKINTSKTQVGDLSRTHLVYVVIEFDDFTHDYLAEYRQQLHEFVSDYPSNAVILQIGLKGEIISA